MTKGRPREPPTQVFFPYFRHKEAYEAPPNLGHAGLASLIHPSRLGHHGVLVCCIKPRRHV